MSRLEDKFIEGGLDAVADDPDLTPEQRALFERAESLDLRGLKKTPMPEDLAWRIQAETRGQRSWARSDVGLAAAALLLLALLPPAVGAFLLDQRSPEFSILELPVTTVRFLPLPNAPGAALGGTLVQAAESPTHRLVVEGGLGKKLDSVRRPLSEGRFPPASAVHTEALVNAVPFAAKTELVAELGPAPWSAETRLLRVQVSARTSVTAAQLDVAFNLDRVASYRLLASSLASDAAPSGRLAEGESFVALFEVVPKMTIGDQGGELATLRYRADAKDRTTLGVAETHVSFDAMPTAYRYAASAAWFGLALSGESAPRVFERILVLASNALVSAPKEEARAFLRLVAQAQAADANRAAN